MNKTGLPVGAYNVALIWTRENGSHEQYETVNRLLNQCYYGLAAKRELENLLDEMGVQYIK